MRLGGCFLGVYCLIEFGMLLLALRLYTLCLFCYIGLLLVFAGVLGLDCLFWVVYVGAVCI